VKRKHNETEEHFFYLCPAGMDPKKYQKYDVLKNSLSKRKGRELTKKFLKFLKGRASTPKSKPYHVSHITGL
jgi:hypothetical protein